jgi:hypothetical protein
VEGTHQFTAVIMRSAPVPIGCAHLFAWGVGVSGWAEGGGVEMCWKRYDEGEESKEGHGSEEGFGWHTGVLMVGLTKM